MESGADNPAYEYEKPPPYAPPGQQPPPQPKPPMQPSNNYNPNPPIVNQSAPMFAQNYPGVPNPTAYPPPNYTYHGHQSGYGATTVTLQPTNFIVVGGCPVCRIGILETDFTCLGVMCALFFFPLGVLFCLAMRQRRCANCGAIFG